MTRPVTFLLTALLSAALQPELQARGAVAPEIPKRIDVLGHPPVESVRVDRLEDVTGKRKSFMGQAELWSSESGEASPVPLEARANFNWKKGRTSYTLRSAKGQWPKVKIGMKTSGDPREGLVAFTLSYVSSQKQKVRVKGVASVVLRLPPPAPEGLRAEAISETAIRVTWTRGPDEVTSHEIRRGRPDDLYMELVGSVDGQATVFEDHGLLPETEYQYCVRALSSVGESPCSEVVAARTPATLIAAPTGLAVTRLFRTNAALTWSDESQDEEAFRIYRGSSPSSVATPVGEVAAGETRYVDPRLEPERTYYYRVVALSGSSESASSNIESVTTLSDITGEWSASLTARTILNMDARCFGQTITGTFVGDITRPSHQSIEFRGPDFNAQGLFASDQVIVLTGGALPTAQGIVVPAVVQLGILEDGSHMVAGAPGGTTVGACPVDMLSLVLEIVEPVPLPSAPVDLAATAASSTEISLSWQPGSGPLGGFRVYRSASATGGFGLLATLRPQLRRYTDAGLQPSTRYWYRVAAYNAAGETLSDAVAAMTQAPGPSPPAAPSELAAEPIGSDAIRLTWRDNSQDETSFTIERSLSALSGWAQAGSVGARETTFTDGGLSAGTTYYYRVQAASPQGVSAYSNVASARTVSSGSVPAAPTDLIAEYLSLSSVRLTWRDNANDETGHIISLSTDGPSSGWRDLAPLPANASSEPITDLRPCTKYWFRVRATNANGDSAPSNIYSWDVNIAAFVTLTLEGDASVFVPGTYSIPCWDRATGTGALGIHDANANGILDDEVAGGANRSFVYPREPQLKNDGSGDWVLVWGGKYAGNSNLVLFFRFSSWTSVDRPQYIALFLRVDGNQVSFVSLFAGDLQHPARDALGTSPGVVMENTAVPAMTVTNGELPTASAAGWLQGSMGGATWFTTPALAGEFSVIYGAGILMDFNLPLLRDH